MKNKIILQYYVLSGLFCYGGLSMISAVYVTFLLKNGLNLMEVNMVNATFFLTLFICEIPTGAFADIFGRKTAFVLACFLLAMAKFVYGCSGSMPGFIVAEILAAIAFTFQSGAFQAWVVDSLKHSGYEGDFTRIFGRQSLINQICAALGAITGAYLYTIDATAPWFFGSFFLVVLTAIAYVIMEEGYFKKDKFSFRGGLRSMGDTAFMSIYYGINNKSVRFVLIITFIQILAVQSLNMYWQPFFKGKGMQELHFGYLYSGMMASLALGAFAVSRMNASGREKKLIISTQIVTGLVIAVAAFAPTMSIGIVLFLMHEIPRGFWAPLKDGYLQKRIPSAERATISSFCSIAPHIGGAIGLIISGAIAQYCGISVAWLFSGLILIVGSILVARNGKDSAD